MEDGVARECQDNYNVNQSNRNWKGMPKLSIKIYANVAL